MMLEKQPQVISRQLNKQQFSHFLKVRSKNSYLLGQNSLYVHNHNKYMGKQLSKQQKIYSSRPLSYPIYHFTNNNSNIYLFPLIGEPITGLSFKRQYDNEVSRWIAKNGSIQAALWSLVRFLLKITTQLNIKDIIGQCIRVQNCNICYCYDSWMNDSRNIIKIHPEQIESYFFSQQDLNEIRQHRTTYSNKRNSLVFRIILYVLNLGTFELKLRNYQMGTYTIKWNNINQRISHFKFKYNSMGLATFIEEVLKGKTITVEELENVITKNNNNSSKKKLTKLTTSKKQNDTNFLSSVTQQENHSFYCDNSLLGISSHNILSEVSNHQPMKMVKLKNNKKTNKQKIVSILPNNTFNLKKKLIEINDEVSMKLIQYLQLDQYVPNTLYQKQLITTIQNIYINKNWQKKIYPNGSVYFGQFLKDQRNGQGLYLFESDDFFYGKWSQNNIHGHGIYIFKSGQTYEGDLENGSKNGHGSYTYSDGRKYQGSWVMNNKKGLGTLKFPNGVVFIGIFGQSTQTQGVFINNITNEEWNGCLESYNYKDKNPTQTKDKQSSNRDQLKKCLIDNYQQYQTLQGYSYEGECTDGKRNGYGIMKMNKQQYRGNWKDDKFHGDGLLYMQNGLSVYGNWKNGILYHYYNKEQSL